jgi:peptidyl-prolyl cis-trans isomerase D
MLLDTFRSGATSIFAKALYSVVLLSAVIGLGMMDYNGVFRGGFKSDTVATVAGEKISVQQFDNAVRQQLSQVHLDARTAYQMGYINQILDAQIGNDLLTRATYDLGIQVDQDTVTKLIGKQLDEVMKSGQAKGVTKKELLQSLLRNRGMNEAQFAHSMQTEVANGLVQVALIKNGGNLPDAEVRDLYKNMHEERTIKFVFLSDSAVKDYKEPDDAVLKPLYDKVKERFAIPETRNFSVLFLTGDSLKKTTEISEADLKKAYDEASSSYVTPEKRTLQQAVFKDEMNAKAAGEKVKKGAALKDAAGSSWVGELTTDRKGMTAEIADPVFAAAKGDVVGPLQSPLGFHLFVVKDVTSEKSLSFAEAKEKIRSELLTTRISDELYRMSGQLDDKLASGAPLEEAAKDIGGKIEKFEAMRANGKSPDEKDLLADHADDKGAILKSAFDLGEGEASSVLQLKDGSYAAIRIDHINPKSYKTYESVKADLRKTWIADQQNTLNRDKAKAAFQALDTGNSALEKIAQDSHTDIQTLTMERVGETKGVFTDDAKKIFFDLAKGSPGFAAGKDGYIIGQVADIKLPDTAKISAAEVDALGEGFKKTTRDQYLQSYTQWLRTRYRVSVNNETLKQVYGRDDGDSQN